MPSFYNEQVKDLPPPFVGDGVQRQDILLVQLFHVQVLFHEWTEIRQHQKKTRCLAYGIQSNDPTKLMAYIYFPAHIVCSICQCQTTLKSLCLSFYI